MGGMFEHTQASYWGGPWYNYWTLVVMSVFGGFIGLDHLWLRSPQTAFLKALLLIPTLGLWYFYDLLQIFGDRDSVMKNGLTAPISGPLGIGAGMFMDNNKGATPSKKSPIIFLAYMALLYFPFGFDFVIAGDTNGAFAKFLTSFIMFLWPIGFIWSFLNLFRAVVTPRSLFDYGTMRMIPFTLFMEYNGPSTLGPKDPTTPCDDPSGPKGFFQWIIDSLLNAVLPGIRPAIGAVGSLVASGAGLVTGVLDNLVKPAAFTAATVVGSAPGAVAAAGQMVPNVIKGVEAQLQGPAGAAGAIAVGAAGSKAVKAVQTGGALVSQNPFVFPALMFVLVSIMGVGGVLGFLELKRHYTLSRNANESVRKPSGTNGIRDDTPPRPYVL